MMRATDDMLSARERLATLGWIAPRSEYFHHLPPPGIEVWMGADGAGAPDVALDATDGWNIDALDTGRQPEVTAEWLDATESAGRGALFAGMPAPGDSDADRFAWAHQAVCRRGLRLQVAADAQAARLALHRTVRAALEAPALVIDVAAGAHCILVETHESDPAIAGAVQNLQLHVRLGDGARLQHVRIVTPQAEDQWAHVIHAAIGSGASYEQALIANGSRYHLQRTELDLRAAHSSGHVGAALFAAGNKLEQQVEAFHHDVATRSNVETLMLASGRAHGVVNAMCRIAHGAENAWARQRLSGIPTAGQPRLTLRPHMEICHDKVEAVHGATWGALPAQALFYARQRGLDERTARALIVKGMMIALLTHSMADDAELLESLGIPERLDRAVAAYLGADEPKVSV